MSVSTSQGPLGAFEENVFVFFAKIVGKAFGRQDGVVPGVDQQGGNADAFDEVAGRGLTIEVIGAVVAIYARENGQGMVFSEETRGDEPPPPVSSPGGKKPALKVVK